MESSFSEFQCMLTERTLTKEGNPMAGETLLQLRFDSSTNVPILSMSNALVVDYQTTLPSCSSLEIELR